MLSFRASMTSKNKLFWFLHFKEFDHLPHSFFSPLIHCDKVIATMERILFRLLQVY